MKIFNEFMASYYHDWRSEFEWQITDPAIATVDKVKILSKYKQAIEDSERGKHVSGFLNNINVTQECDGIDDVLEKIKKEGVCVIKYDDIACLESAIRFIDTVNELMN